MKKVATIQLKRHGRVERVSLYDEIDSFYQNSKKANEIIGKIREIVINEISKIITNSVEFRILIEDTDATNAFATKVDEYYYIVLTRGIILQSYLEVKKWSNSSEFSEMYKLSDENRESYEESIWHFMLLFLVFHEMGHILDGHLKANIGERQLLYIDEVTVCNKIENWKRQILEYDADKFASYRMADIIKINCKRNWEFACYMLDNIGIVLLLIFNLLSKKRKKEFESYMKLSIDSVDHPHPGIRINYCLIIIFMSLLEIWSVEEVRNMFIITFDGIVRTEKVIFEKELFKDVLYSVAYTKKGNEHTKKLINGWNELAKEYKKDALIPLNITDDLEIQKIFVDEKGNLTNPFKKIL